MIQDPVMAQWPEALARNAPHYLRAASLKEMRILVAALSAELFERARTGKPKSVRFSMAADALAICVDRLDEILGDAA